MLKGLGRCDPYTRPVNELTVGLIRPARLIYMLFRPQRGSLSDSMADEVELPATRKALAGHLVCPEESVDVKPYCYDGRIGWDTYLVIVDGQAVGFTDRAVE